MSVTFLSGISGSAKAHFLFKCLSERYVQNSDLRAFLFVKDDELDSFYDDLNVFFQKDYKEFPIILFPSDDAQQRTFAIDKIQNLKSFIICAGDISYNLPVAAPGDDRGIVFKHGQKHKFEELICSIVSLGYTRTSFVEDRLQFSIRGDIIDIWPAANIYPVRILFEYDTIEALRIFDPASQLSNTFIDKIKVLPLNLQNDTALIKDYFDDKSMLYFDYTVEKEEELVSKKYELFVNAPLNKKSEYQGYKSFTGFHGDIKFFINSLENFARNSVNIKIYCANDGERERIHDLFYENGWKYEVPEFLYGNLSQGFYLEKENFACLSSREMLYKKKPISFPKVQGGRRLEGIWEISAGDYVVHEKYGIGRYIGLKTISREDKTSEYLCIEYRKGDKLYVPPEEIKTVKKYIGVEGVKPKLYSMDTGAWERIKSRAREAAAEFAKELLKLYTERSKVKRQPLSRETTWEKELEDAFPYEETPDQLKAIEDVKSDFLKPYPMERLICGDVGYGKTEIAVRATFKIVQDGMQAAVLVPTTVLAQQHFNTFYNRLSPFPTKIVVLSRFQSKAQQKKTVEEIAQGRVDIVIGTHRLLQKDIKFKNLGMLIVDEEHRFGVKQKEKIKSIKKNIDMLMLSATPIPRTLSSSLSGFRDLSLIETPPFGRLPIETSLSEYDENMIKTIIGAELSRNGQVFYVYNKVETILAKASEIKRLVPDIKLGVIHGQMKTADIEEIMWRFTNAELDVLLATTIIESGLDIPSVNTMIVEEAENFGLSQLYQLRGRIGRDKRKAYCYLFYKDKHLSDEAVKRLEAMKEFSELGSGFRLALKDLEIRGAGGILSANQHGFVRDIGYDMFAKLLEEEGKKIKGKTVEREKDLVCEIDLQISALIPDIYIENDDIRILFYRKLSNAKKAEDIENVKNELTDRFGKIPQETQKLFEIARIRLKAEKLKIERISEDNKYIYVLFSQNADFSNADIKKFINDYSDMIEFIMGKHYAFKLKKEKINGTIVDFIKTFLQKLEVLYIKV
ncbi:MAG: transcription-repair coupling factor [Endomicrobium sp.]|jgi:transcription-repair coupling factor (superfamily II helicase)|nr:transcription-repair coupling factor [Endomicrobium sp.]